MFFEIVLLSDLKLVYQVVLTLARILQMLDAVGVNGYLKSLEIFYQNHIVEQFEACVLGGTYTGKKTVDA